MAKPNQWALQRPSTASSKKAPGLTSFQTLVFAVACGAMVANLYYAQPLLGLISPALGIRPGLAGLIVTLTQIGYGVGLLLIVPFGDLVENRSLILMAAAGVVIGLVGTALSSSALLFLASYFLVGVCSVGAQILVPLAAQLTPEESRGRVLGNIMAGLIGGIMLARSISSFFAAEFGWRAIFWASALAMLCIMGLLWRVVPLRRPKASLGYGALLASTVRLLWTERALRRRAFYQGVLFAIFNLFWTAAPLMLRDVFGFTQSGIALFALAGAGGALSAPLAGRFADRGRTQVGTAICMALASVAFVAVGWAAGARSVAALVAAIVLDAATQANHIFSQRVIYSLSADAKSRLNSAYMTAMFMFGALGSVVAGFTYVHAGWLTVCGIGAGLGAALLVIFATE